ncbi:E3 ubiquitin ligase complex SCF subunit sconC isoform X2 [Nasonia vitripennis]|nr:E3 ubiquitin ligase complex SCF subunit sconC isoform X2 [Nasonia vitripennis]
MSQVKLVSNDGVRFTVDSEIVKKCMKTVKNLFDGLGKFEPEEEIPIPVVNGEILKKVMDWVIHHKGEPPFYQEVRDIREWDKNFLEVDDETLSDIIEAANYLEMGDLLQLCYVHTWRDK